MLETHFRWFGGRLIFDFCNTILIHPEFELELLKTEEDLRRWFAYIGYENILITPQILKDLIALRNELRNVFELLLEKEEQGIEALNGVLAKYQTNLQIRCKENSCQIQYFSEKEAQGILLSELLKVFEKIELKRIKACDNERCSHFFYDVSKANRRKWCDMDSCGNKMKAKRFYERKKNG